MPLARRGIREIAAAVSAAAATARPTLANASWFEHRRLFPLSRREFAEAVDEGRLDRPLHFW
jgi:hypothetical protein